MTSSEPTGDSVFKGRGTAACRRFFAEHARLGHFIGFISDLATRADETHRIAREALREPPPDPEKGALATLRSHRQLVLEMVLSRGVDNYLAYLSELLALLFETRPETLRAKADDDGGRRGEQGEAVPLDVVLEHATMEDLRSFLAERRITDLSYKGMAGLAAYLSRRLGFLLFEDDESLEKVVRIVELRNLIAHNRAVVNRIYRKRTGDESLVLGELVELDVDQVFETLDLLASSVRDIDSRAAEKWGLAVEDYSSFLFLGPE